jgi:hypothetical protein
MKVVESLDLCRAQVERDRALRDRPDLLGRNVARLPHRVGPEGETVEDVLAVVAGDLGYSTHLLTSAEIAVQPFSIRSHETGSPDDMETSFSQRDERTRFEGSGTRPIKRGRESQAERSR